MQQLWLDHQRIDSIAQLRGLLREKLRQSDEALNDICMELLSKLESGCLKRWLQRQSEYHDPTLQPKGESAQLHRTVRALCKSHDTEDNRLEELAKLMDLPQEALPYGRLRELYYGIRQAGSEKRTLLEAEPWWEDYQALFASVGSLDWSLVVLDNIQLQLALEELRVPHPTQRTLYLCNGKQMEKSWYVLDLRGLEKVTVCGIANPRVKYSYYAENQTVNVEEQQIYLRDFRLRFTEHCSLKNYQNASVNFEVFGVWGEVNEDER